MAGATEQLNPANLRPYGAPPTERTLGPLVLLQSTPAALARATLKLAQCRADNPACPPLGRPCRRGLPYLAIGILTFVLAAVLVVVSTFPVTLPLILLVGLAMFWRASLDFLAPAPDTPDHCLQEFLRCFKHRDIRGIARLVCPADLDSTERFLPGTAGVQHSRDRGVAFDGTGAARYWRSCFVIAHSARLVLQPAGTAPVQLAPDIIQVTLRMWLERSFRVQAADEWFAFTKLLVRCGSEWRLFSGELQAPEEQDLSWLAEFAGQGSDAASAPETPNC